MDDKEKLRSFLKKKLIETLGEAVNHAHCIDCGDCLDRPAEINGKKVAEKCNACLEVNQEILSLMKRINGIVNGSLTSINPTNTGQIFEFKNEESASLVKNLLFDLDAKNEKRIKSGEIFNDGEKWFLDLEIDKEKYNA